jgi:hypothetical protein
MKANTKSEANTKNIAKSTKGVKPLIMVSEVRDIKEQFGKYSILIKGNVIYRCSTDTSEKGPKALNDLYLPKYGKMRKFVVKSDGVYELKCNEEHPYENSNLAKYEITEKVNIDATKIDFTVENTWNNKKAAV